MYNSDTEMIVPLRVAPTLTALRSELWSELVERISSADANPLEQKAFILMMARLANCGSCGVDSFRAMRGCTQCARQCIRRYRGSDDDINMLFRQYVNEVTAFLNKNKENSENG